MVYRYRSLAIGASALLLGALHWHTATLEMQKKWLLVNLLERVGLMRHDPNAVTTARSAGTVGIDAQFLVMWLGYCAIVFAVCGIFYALKADHQHEPSLYPAVGCALAALALSLVNPYAGFAGFIITALLLARERTRSTEQ